MKIINRGVIKKWLFSYTALFSHRWGFKKEESEFYQTYSFSTSESSIVKGLVIMFDGRQIHCGITDRLKGICSIYEYSKKNKLPFYIYFRSPFKLEDYLLPNKQDWKIEDKDIVYNRNGAIPVFINDWQSLTSLHIMYLNTVIKHNKDKQIHVYSNSPYYVDRYPDNFSFLFKWSDVMDKRIKDCIISIGSENYIAIAMRFQQLLGDFKEDHTIFKVLDTDEQDKLMQKCLSKIEHIIEENKIKSKVLVTCDSKKFLDYIAFHPQLYIVPGNVAHIDNSHNMDKTIYDKLFLDMAMLSHAQKIYQLISGDMYKNSGFARQAAVIGKIEYRQLFF